MLFLSVIRLAFCMRSFLVDGVDVDDQFQFLSYKTKLRAHKLCCG